MSNNSAKTIAWVGAGIGIIGGPFGDNVDLIISGIGAVLAVIDCMFWAQAKEGYWAFGFWGLLAPIGFSGGSLLEDRS